MQLTNYKNYQVFIYVFIIIIEGSNTAVHSS